ncbi:thiopurine S-methyltransferase [Candidatus Venteria ishoeyi]|uniref:Thiopurine S-methyltransferase n=1 Tax=Candidatus Venteria ishoeyi TaxID=1899563 RepID=A0A1H6FIG2_9GAMM|nr:thiopurine S-methyltransferase [Candidatus Venteria ishoeyi]SEH08804.1 Thiopurine S-methyltransferase [Candidatus Venteria ishoeyi]
MKLEFWHQRWEAGKIGFHQADINVYLQKYWHQLDLPAQSQVFVPLCGKTLDMLWLLEQGLEVIGIETSETAIEDFFSENGLTPTIQSQGAFQCWQQDQLCLLQGDFFALETDDLQGFNAVYDRASLVALPPAMRQQYAEKMAQLLPPDTPILLISMEYPQTQMDGPPFSVTESEIKQLYAQNFSVECLDRVDILADNPRFQQRGLAQMDEVIYRLTRL